MEVSITAVVIYLAMSINHLPNSFLIANVIILSYPANIPSDFCLHDSANDERNTRVHKNVNV